MRFAVAIILSLLIAVSSCKKQEGSGKFETNTLRVAVEKDPQSLDPRFSRTLIDTTTMYLLYEGLLRRNGYGKPELALADKLILSPDKKSYEIHLKNSEWSDGSPLTADDFIETWKSVLDPSFPSPNAGQLFVIKNARAAKKGEVALDDVGLKKLSDSSFVVELEYPVAYFPELLASQFYLPVHEKARGNSHASPEELVFNGPFVLTSWKPHNELVFTGNTRYWDAGSVNLEQVKFIISDEMTALSLYQRDKLDWIGSPLSTLPQDAITTLKRLNVLEVANADGTYWFRFNTESMPFKSLAMRKAFNDALNREEIVEHVTQGNQKPALSILPPSLELQEGGYYLDNQIVAAWNNFQAALEELKVSKDELPEIVICYGNSDRNHKIAQAVQQQWQKAFNVPISLQACEQKISYDKLAKGDYQIMLGSWFADIADPINFLDVFKSKNNGINHTHWENSDYARLIDSSNLAATPALRQELLHQAETLLMESVPVAPLFFNTYNYVAKEYVSGVYFSALGYLDFKNANLKTSFVDEDSE